MYSVLMYVPCVSNGLIFMMYWHKGFSLFSLSQSLFLLLVVVVVVRVVVVMVVAVAVAVEAMVSSSFGIHINRT